MASSVSKLFLQSLLSRGAVPEKLARKIWLKCIEATNAVHGLELPIDDNDDSWRHFVSTLNNTLDTLDFVFQASRDQKSGNAMYCIINTKSDTVAQLATDYTPAETAYFKAIVEQIMHSPRHKYSITSMVALREVSMIKPKSNITKSQAEIVLSSFVAKGWLLKSKDGRYSLSGRSLMELGQYLRNNFPDRIILCSICEELLTQGVACFHQGCKCRVHPYCFQRYARVRANGPLQCKLCEFEWPRDLKSDSFIHIGDLAIRRGEHEGRVNTTGSASEGEDEEGEENEGTPEATQQTQPMQTQARKSTQTKRKAKQGVEDDSEEDNSPTQTVPRTRRSARR